MLKEGGVGSWSSERGGWVVGVVRGGGWVVGIMRGGWVGSWDGERGVGG